MLEYRALTERVIGLAIDVHRTVGPGLLESVYVECMCVELEQVGISFRRQVMVPVVYKNTMIPLGFRADIMVENSVILEIKAVSALTPAHDAQLLTYLRMSEISCWSSDEFPCDSSQGWAAALYCLMLDCHFILFRLLKTVIFSVLVIA